ncbi:MAG: VOC family protein [Candidatus Binatus sp.]|uniref:VOC family protein n=1 Tax=Candidatus Binatus sp. TaxID=2811406 RepID=UPI0027284AF7|nr:VOC family protein [Candidatus Binatus sp.]MDO8434800.1 VOC family protein [Candidatus Binatus sp.]
MELPFKVAELDHVVLRCRDQTRALDFYTRVLGLAEERRIEQIGLIQLRAGASMIDLVPASGARDERGLNVDHFCLGIEARDLNEIAGYLRDLGVEVIGEPATRYGARGMGLSIYIRDSEGNVVELKQLAAQS